MRHIFLATFSLLFFWLMVTLKTEIIKNDIVSRCYPFHVSYIFKRFKWNLPEEVAGKIKYSNKNHSKSVQVVETNSNLHPDMSNVRKREIKLANISLMIVFGKIK